MNVVIFCHSIVSDWNHGNAHFLRGIARELLRRGAHVRLLEPKGGWSVSNLVKDQGFEPLHEFRTYYPDLQSEFYTADSLHLDRVLGKADLVLVHEWNEPKLVSRIGAHRKTSGGYLLLFHDTHHRSVSAPRQMSRYDLSAYDGVLCFGRAVAAQYRAQGWAKRVFVWHEAADTSVFYPRERMAVQGDLVWIGNWGDNERTEELEEFLLEPVRRLGLRATAYGVRYPASALNALQRAGITYGGWIPNYRVPEVFSRFRLTVHIPRRPYVQQLPGIPTIRPFEALACGLPLISATWVDSERLFRADNDFLMVRDGQEMQKRIAAVLHDHTLAHSLACSGREQLLQRHTCRHRVNELLEIARSLRGEIRLPPVCSDLLREDT
ncbi:MAG: glycosyltransferase, partial [Bdellovibrionales bacterium]|nr:glycosyltransferase [Bdellovibrionales bacterium]